MAVYPARSNETNRSMEEREMNMLSSKTITYEQLAKVIDHSLLKPELTEQDVIQGCQLAARYHTATVCVKPCHVSLAANLLKGTDVKISTVIGFPHGSNRTDIKVAEANGAIDDGAVELDMVLNIGALRSGRSATNAADAWEMLQAVENAGVFHGYLEDLVYTPKTLKAMTAAENGALGKVLWARSRETHGGPHSDWFWNKQKSGGGAIVDMGCHCIEIARGFLGKGNRPLEVSCWADTQVHPIDVEDHAVGLVRYESGGIGQFEVSWTFRGGMDLRDEVAGTEGTIWLNHWLRTGFEMFTSVGQGGYIAEKAEGDTGWQFPVGDEAGSLGYVEMFKDMFNSMDAGRKPMEDFYDGYIVNAIIDACYKSALSKKWEPIEIQSWRGGSSRSEEVELKDYDFLNIY